MNNKSENHQQDRKKEHLAMQDTLSVIGGKWRMILLGELLINGKKQFRQLAHAVGITARMLSKELAELEINQLVKRTVLNTRPITVEYSATAYAETIRVVIIAMSKWGIRHREVITGRYKDLNPVSVYR
jgi:DNA-binding HxlR family transcriptional regulator